MKISRESYALVAICMADLASTIFLVNYRQATEGNPLMAKYLEYGIGAFVLAKAVLCLMPLFLLEYARRHRPRVGQIGLRVALAGYLFAYVSGVAQLNELQLTHHGKIVSAGMMAEGMSEADQDVIQRQAEFYRQNREIIRTARLRREASLRGESPTP